MRRRSVEPAGSRRANLRQGLASPTPTVAAALAGPRLTHNPSRTTVDPEIAGYLGDVGLAGDDDLSSNDVAAQRQVGNRLGSAGQGRSANDSFRRQVCSTGRDMGTALITRRRALAAGALPLALLVPRASFGRGIDLPPQKREVMVASADELVAALLDAQAGDHIVLNDGSL